jgi:hypothetical protein
MFNKDSVPTTQANSFSKTARRRVATALAASALASALCVAPRAHAEERDIPIPKAVLALAFNAALAGVEVNLDTYGQQHGTSWFDNKSHILLPNGTRTPVPLKEQSLDVTNRRTLKYYVDDMKSSRVAAAVDGNKIKLSIFFESQGEEIKAKCVRDPLIGKDKECGLDIERDVQLDNARLEILVTPTVFNHGISYSGTDVKFKTDVKIANRLCQTFKGICGKIENLISHEVRQAVESSVDKAFDSDKSRGSFANSVGRFTGVASRLTGFHVESIRSTDTDFIVHVSR